MKTQQLADNGESSNNFRSHFGSTGRRSRNKVSDGEDVCCEACQSGASGISSDGNAKAGCEMRMGIRRMHAVAVDPNFGSSSPRQTVLCRVSLPF